jgi:hypothetical protein
MKHYKVIVVSAGDEFAGCMLRVAATAAEAIALVEARYPHLTAVEAIETQSIRCNHSALGYPAQNSIAA